MCSGLLNLALKIGRIFAITPPSTSPGPVSRANIFHSVAFVTVLGTVVFASKYFTCAVCGLFLAKRIVVVAIIVNLYAYNCSTALNALTKRGKWGVLIDNLKLTKPDDKLPEKNFANLKFAFSHLVFFGVNFVIQYTLTSQVGLDHLKMNFSALVLQPYLYFIHSLCIYSILEVVLLRYKSLKDQISRRDHLHNAFRLEDVVCLLSESVECVNEIFAWPLALQVSYSTIMTVNCLHNAITLSSQIMGIAINVLTLLPTVVLCWMCEAILREAKKTLLLIHQSASALTEEAERRRVREFANYFSANLPNFTAAGLFPLNIATPLGIFGTAITFLIVLLQLDSEEFSAYGRKWMKALNSSQHEEH